MPPRQPLTSLLSTVGLLRVTLHNIMQTIDDARQAYRASFHPPPPQLSPLMGEAQQYFAELLKASEYLSLVEEESQRTQWEGWGVYLEEWATSHAVALFKTLRTFFERLAEDTVPGVDLDPALWQGGLTLLQDMLDRVPDA